MRAVTVRPDRSIARHFLLRDLRLTCRLLSGGGGAPVPVAPSGDGFVVEIDDRQPCQFQLLLEARHRYQADEFVVLRIEQVYAIESSAAPWLVPVRWLRGGGPTSGGAPVGNPSQHPLLESAGNEIVFVPRFLEITDLFMRIHGATPYFQTLAFLKRTDFSLRVLACLHGHPLIWYAAVPRRAAGSATVAPHVCYWAADYGGISYVADAESGITTKSHSTTVGNIQCGGETLCSYLLSPLGHGDYTRLLPAYAELRRTFQRFKTSPAVVLPWQLHRYRGVLDYELVGGKPFPLIWAVPFGLERAIEGTEQVILFPVLNGGEAGVAIRPRLKALIDSAVLTLSTQGATFTAPVVAAGRLVLSCYSQSGGNVFTACGANAPDVKAIVCAEPQYMNEYLGTENRNLALGRVAIPKLLRAGGKVVLIGRRAEAWQRNKYLPRGVPRSSLILLPTDAGAGVLDYPPARSHRLVAHRMRRLLDHRHDDALTHMLGQGRDQVEPRMLQSARQVNEWIDRRRAQSASDDALVSEVFPPELNRDVGGAFYTHNFVMAGGQDESAFEADGSLKPDRRYMTFLQQALALVA